MTGSLACTPDIKLKLPKSFTASSITFCDTLLPNPSIDLHGLLYTVGDSLDGNVSLPSVALPVAIYMRHHAYV